MKAGQIIYTMLNSGGLIVCENGELERLSAMWSTELYKTHHLINNFNSWPFNSVNDVVIHVEGRSIWVTDQYITRSIYYI
jgi:sugar lactone lactonase YvrE